MYSLSIPKDSCFINLIKKEIITDDKNLEGFIEDKRNAIKNYDKNYDYQQTFNDAFYLLYKEDMDQFYWF